MNLESHPSTGPTRRQLSALNRRFKHLRVALWQGNPTVALVGPSRGTVLPLAGDIAACTIELASLGIDRIVTPALGRHDAFPFEQAGYTVREHLFLLARSLSSPPPAPKRTSKPGRPWHQTRVLEIDNGAFDDFWRFDKVALQEARSATPAHRYRIAAVGQEIAGYHITGKAANRGYLQRLAVDPRHFGKGIGTDLVYDCLTWLFRSGAREVLVNTQEANQRALRLYEHLGFVRQEPGLLVMGWENPA